MYFRSFVVSFLSFLSPGAVIFPDMRFVSIEIGGMKNFTWKLFFVTCMMPFKIYDHLTCAHKNVQLHWLISIRAIVSQLVSQPVS